MTKSSSPITAGAPTKPGKLEQVLGAVRSRQGATMAELAAATGWQPHSVRAALTRLRQRGLLIKRVDTAEGSRYRLMKTR